MVNLIKNKWAVGLVLLTAVAAGWAYGVLYSKYSALEQQLSQIRPLPAASIPSSPKPADDGRETALIALDARLDPLQRQMKALQGEVARLEQQMELIAAWQQAAGVSLGGDSSQAPPAGEPGIQTPEERHLKASSPSPAERAQELWERFSQEERAEAWAFGVEAAIQSAFSTVPELAKVRIGELDCRTNMCRLTWEFAEDLTSEDYFILENEIVAALGTAGLSQGSQIGTGNEIEGYFFRKEPQSEPPPRED